MLYDTTSYLIPSLRQRSFVPQSNATFLVSDMLRLMSEVMNSRVVPHILSVYEEYFVHTLLVPFVAGQAEYDVPARALGGELRNVYVLTSDGITSRPLYQEEPEKLVGAYTASNGAPSQFAMRDTEVRVYPPPADASEQLAFQYHKWPSALVDLASQAAQVLSVAGNVVTCTAALPPGWSSLPALDVVAGTPPFKHRALDQQPSAASGSTLTFATLPAGLVKGDYLALSGEAPVAQIPVAAFPLLLEGTAAEMMRATKDLEAAQAADTAFEDKAKKLKSVIGDRVKGQVRRLTNGMDKWRGPRVWPGWNG